VALKRRIAELEFGRSDWNATARFAGFGVAVKCNDQVAGQNTSSVAIICLPMRLPRCAIRRVFCCSSEVIMEEAKLRTRVRLHDGRVGEILGIKYIGSTTGKRPAYIVKFSTAPADTTFCRAEDFVVLPEEAQAE
jgi:hypothetical protein